MKLVESRTSSCFSCFIGKRISGERIKRKIAKKDGEQKLLLYTDYRYHNPNYGYARKREITIVEMYYLYLENKLCK